MQSGEPLITLVPTSAPLEVETRIAAADAGYVVPGQKVAIKFDTFPFVQYGMAEGTVRFISPTASAVARRRSVVMSSRQGDRNDVFYKARMAMRLAGYCTGCPAARGSDPGMTVTADMEIPCLPIFSRGYCPSDSEGMRRA